MLISKSTEEAKNYQNFSKCKYLCNFLPLLIFAFGLFETNLRKIRENIAENNY